MGVGEWKYLDSAGYTVRYGFWDCSVCELEECDPEVCEPTLVLVVRGISREGHRLALYDIYGEKLADGDKLVIEWLREHNIDLPSEVIEAMRLNGEV